MSHVISIDIGTSNIKVGSMTKDGEVTIYSKDSYPLIYPKSGWLEIDADKVWQKTQKMINDAIQQVELNGGIVDAISLSTFCNSSICMDRDGNSLSNGIMYLDNRSKKQAENIKAKIGDDVLYKITRNRLEPGMYTVTSLLWFKENNPALFDQVSIWGNLSTFILNKLSGNFVMDWTQASYSGLFDVVKHTWSLELCEKLGIDQSILPKVVSPFDYVGDYNSIPIIAGAADTACSSLALCLTPGEIFESVGTSNVLTLCSDNADQLDVRFLNRCFVWEDEWLSHGAMSTPGAALKWFFNNFLKDEGNEANVLEKLPEQSTIGANGVFFLPYMQGERSPIWDPDARGVFSGLHLNTSKADMLRAMLEGSAFGLKQIYAIMEDIYHVDLLSFRSIGGGSKNRTWAQIKANVLKKEIEVQEVSETGIYGSCLLAAKAVGYFKNKDEIKSYVKNETVYTIKPNPETFETYDDLYTKFTKLYPALKGTF